MFAHLIRQRLRHPLGAGTALLTTTLLMLLQPCPAMASGAASYPDKPIRLVVAYGIGGVADNIGRLLAAGLSKALGQSVFVDNRGGAGGTIGAAIVAKDDPDGYTLLLTSPPMIAVAPLLLPHLSYNAVRDFTPIGTFVTTPNILVVNKSLPVKTLADLIAYAKGPGKGKLSFASGGTGSTGELSGQILKATAGIQLTDVPYKSSAMAFPDLIAGRVSMLFDAVPSTVGFVRAGQVRPIVVMSDKRAPLLPNVPTAAEEGYPAATMQFWMGIEGPAKMPPAIVAKLSAALKTAIGAPGMAKSLENLGAQPFWTSPQAFSALRERDIAKYKPLVKETGLSLEH